MFSFLKRLYSRYSNSGSINKYPFKSLLIISYNNESPYEVTVGEFSPNKKVVKDDNNHQWLEVSKIRVLDVVHVSETIENYNMQELRRIVTKEIENSIATFGNMTEFSDSYVDDIVYELCRDNSLINKIVNQYQVSDYIDHGLIDNLQREFMTSKYPEQIYAKYIKDTVEYYENALDDNSPINSFNSGIELINVEDSEYTIYKKDIENIGNPAMIENYKKKKSKESESTKQSDFDSTDPFTAESVPLDQVTKVANELLDKVNNELYNQFK
jgi:hypothetical protein